MQVDEERAVEPSGLYPLLASLLPAGDAFSVQPRANVAAARAGIAGAVPLTAPVVVEDEVVDFTMGRGDKRTAKGKRKAKSFGNSRLRNGELRRRRDGPGEDLGAARPAVAVAEPEPVAEAAPEPEPEPEPVAEAAPALSAGEIMAAVKAVRADLPKIDLKACKGYVEAAGGDVEAAKAAILADKADEWAAEEAANEAALKAATAAAMDLKDKQAEAKFEKAQAKAAAAEEEAAPAPEPEPEPVAEAAPEPAAEAAPAAEEGKTLTMLTPDATAAKAGMSPANAILLTPAALASKAGLQLM